MRRLLGIVVLLSVGQSDRASAAQCPDGSSPPCALARPGARAPVDRNAIAVLPFRTVGASTEVAWLREGMVDLLSAALDGFAGWRAMPPRTVLARASEVSDLGDVASAARMARAAGAGTMVLGSAVAVGQQLRLHAELYDAVEVRRLAAVDASGALAQPGPVIDSIGVGLARERLREHPIAGRRSPIEYATTSPQALRVYLAAERHARSGELQAAADSLLHAIALDSAFGLAYYRLYIVSTLPSALGNPSPSVRQSRIETVRLGLQHSATLPPRERDLLAAVYAQERGTVAEALRLGDELGRRYPDDAEAAFEEGEAYFHLGLFFGEPRSRALAAFERATHADPGSPYPYTHAIELRTAIGDTAATWRLLRRLLQVAPNNILGRALELALRAGLRGEDPAALEHSLAGPDTDLLVGRVTLEVLRSFDNEPALAVAVADSFAATRSTADVPGANRLLFLLLRMAIRMAQGRRGAAGRLLHEAAALDPVHPSVLAMRALYALETGADRAGGRAAADRLTRSSSLEWRVLAVSLAVWGAAADGDSATAEGLVRDRFPTELMPEYGDAIRAGARGVLALSRGDTAAARPSLATAIGVVPSSATGAGAGASYMVPITRFAVELARLDLAAGDPNAAERRLFHTSFAQGLVIQRAEAEELRSQIAEQRGDTAAAIRAYRNFIALWKDADPELQPRVAAARAALARLER